LKGEILKNEAKLRRQGEEINQLKTKMGAKPESIQSAGQVFRDELVTELRSSKDNQMGSLNRKEVFSDDSSTRAVVPSSCRDLSLIGHILDGLYLVQNVDKKRSKPSFAILELQVSRF